MSRQVDKALRNPIGGGNVTLPVFCPKCSKVIPVEVSVFGDFGERELMYFAEILLEKHKGEKHGGK